MYEIIYGQCIGLYLGNIWALYGQYKKHRLEAPLEPPSNQNNARSARWLAGTRRRPQRVDAAGARQRRPWSASGKPGGPGADRDPARPATCPRRARDLPAAARSRPSRGPVGPLGPARQKSRGAKPGGGRTARDWNPRAETARLGRATPAEPRGLSKSVARPSGSAAASRGAPSIEVFGKELALSISTGPRQRPCHDGGDLSPLGLCPHPSR